MCSAPARVASLAIAPLMALGALSGTSPAASAEVGPGSGAAAQAAAVNAAPAVVPALREWSGGVGVLALGVGSRVVVDGRALVDEARSFSADVAGVTGLSLPVVSGSTPGAGDVFLSLRGADQGLGREGYGLEVADAAVVRGNDDAGVFYGTQTLLQILTSSPGHRTLPRGQARDWPKLRERGFLLDAGRKYYSPDFIVQAIREMAYLRLNTIQFHFTDHNAFRLVSDRFPYLAAPRAYTKADIRRFEAAARKNHVDIIPEIEMPSHASAILRARPELRFDCPSMGGGTLDVTKPETREFTKALIDEFAPLFSGPEFHIATDEYPSQADMERCPQLVQYAHDHGFGSTPDVFVDFINEMNQVVRSHGKQMVIWNWWDVDKEPTIHPDKNIKIEAWTTSAETGADHSVQRYLDLGYEVVASPSDTHYVTPGFPLLPDPKFLYEEWEPIEHPRLDGYQISVWSDNAITRPDAYFDAHLRRPREALADRLWGGPRHGTVADFFDRADAIGTPPGVPGYHLPGMLSGEPYGTSPAWDNSSSTFEKAFDRDPVTNFLYAEPNGGYTGQDLGAGHESTVSAVRFFPGANDTQLDRMTGGRFEGCTDGPTSGCTTLATVAERPGFGWNELPVTDPGTYRWLRYVSPDDGYTSVAEIEFLAPAGQGVTVDGPATLRQLGDNQVVTTYRNTGDQPVHDVRLDLTASAVDDRSQRHGKPVSKATFPTVAPGQTVSTRWQVDVPLSAVTGGYHLLGHATYQGLPGNDQPRLDARGVTRSTLGVALDAALDPGVVALDPGDSQPAALRITNHAGRAVKVAWNEVRLPTADPGYTLAPAQGSRTIPAGGTGTATLTASSAPDASDITSPLRIDLTATSSGQPETQAGSLDLRIRSRTHPYLSDLDWTEAVSEWDVVTRDTYVGSSEGMTLNGVRYAKGLGAAGNSRISFDLAGKCTSFTSTIGIDDAADFTTSGGTSHFFVFVDGEQVYESGLITREIVKTIDLDVSGVHTLSLVTDNAGDGFHHDAVDWADARVRCS
ncbi:MAG: family 20 glycosylhydrolase [Nocardioidaceae bacterium]